MKGEGGFVRDYRSTIDWEWFTDVNTAHLWEYIRLRVNYEPSRFRGMEIKRGQMIESISTIAKNTGLTYSQVRTALKHLKMTGEIACNLTRYGMLISAVKYDDFQSPSGSNDTQPNNEIATRSQGDRKEIATYKEDKEIKKVRNKEIKGLSETESFTPPTADQVREYAEKDGLSLDIDSFLDYYQNKDWIVSGEKCRDWRYLVRSWVRKDQEFSKGKKTKKKENLPDWYSADPKRSSGSGEKLSADELKAAQEKLKRMGKAKGEQ